jgi:prepilin-type N-terminal cleavage/methylation domain-containing protein/prepilin-type processing-associated H-X9-DG protein
MSSRRAFSLVETIVVIAIIGVMFSLVLAAIPRVRENANRLSCQNNLKQLGISLHNYHAVFDALPPGMVSDGNVSDATATGFTFMLPFLEQDTTFAEYNFSQPWYQPANYTAVGTEIKIFYCPSNRSSGALNLAQIAAEWNTRLPPLAASCDYAFCKGANASLNSDWTKMPVPVRGVFGIRGSSEIRQGVRFDDIIDGTSNTIAMGDATGGSAQYLVRDLNDPTEPAISTLTGQTVAIEQSWGAAGAGDTNHPWYGSVFAVTAQYGTGASLQSEPMNRRPVSPTVSGGDRFGDNRTGKDTVSGFRSLHIGGCNFLFCDGSVHFIPQTIAGETYMALSTYAGNDEVGELPN